jgi:hypothetical protein
MKIEFSFKYEAHGRDNIVEIKECKLPKRTNVYKRLSWSLEQGFIHSFEWKQV